MQVAPEETDHIVTFHLEREVKDILVSVVHCIPRLEFISQGTLTHVKNANAYVVCVLTSEWKWSSQALQGKGIFVQGI